jgi:hypothetical protein
MCHTARHRQRDDFCGFTKQVGHSSLKNLPDQRKFRPVLMDSPPLSEIFTRNRGLLSRRVDELLRTDPKKIHLLSPVEIGGIGVAQENMHITLPQLAGLSALGRSGYLQ